VDTPIWVFRPKRRRPLPRSVASQALPATEESTLSTQHDVEERGRRTGGEDARERLLSGLPVTERRLQLAGVSTAVLEGGDGPPIVLLQGEFAAVWMRVIPELVTTHRVIAPDLPGLGASEASDGPPDADSALMWLDELIEQICAIPPVLVGKGPGGALAARFAIDHSDRIDRLVLVDTLGLDRFRPAPGMALSFIRVLLRPTERGLERGFRHCFLDLDGVRAEMGERYEWMAAYALDRFRTPTVNAAMRSLMRQLASAIPSGHLDRIAVPTTLIWGRHDVGVRLNVAEAASARYGWPLHVIEDARDDPAIEQPEAFLGALRTALDSPSWLQEPARHA
jgi:pimeloyl-ACP methyl ester carboxylesterase